MCDPAVWLYTSLFIQTSLDILLALPPTTHSHFIIPIYLRWPSPQHLPNFYPFFGLFLLKNSDRGIISSIFSDHHTAVQIEANPSKFCAAALSLQKPMIRFIITLSSASAYFHSKWNKSTVHAYWIHLASITMNGGYLCIGINTSLSLQ